ncbi:histidine phosphatase family protein [Pectobacteriaceae bacterium CE90]|nr:histidine phosphatase family protein [Pectobacteriaceae bacterium CE90]
MKVILVRHAETEWNLRGIIQGHSDSAVTHRGLRETSALLTTLEKSAYPIESVYASPIGRAWQMGRRLAESFRCPLMAEPALKEQALGCFEGMTSEHVIQHNPDEANALFVLDAEYCPPGGESLAQASQRVIHFLNNLQVKTLHQTICIVSHGHVIQGVLAILKEGAIDNFPRYAQPNASYSVFNLIDGKCIALKWGIATHLLQLEQHVPFEQSTFIRTRPS